MASPPTSQPSGLLRFGDTPEGRFTAIYDARYRDKVSLEAFMEEVEMPLDRLQTAASRDDILGTYLRGAGVRPTEAPARRRGNLSESAAQGATFGFSDEIAAGVAAPLLWGAGRIRGERGSLGDYHSLALERARGGLEDVEERHPVASTVAEVGGALAGGVVTGGVGLLPRAAATTGGRIAQAAGLGAAGGATAGFGEGEGGFVNRAVGAATGGAVGGLAGGALGVVVEGGARVVRNFRDPSGRAERDILRALDDDGVTLDAVEATYNPALQGQALIDAGKHNLWGMAGAAHRSSTQARREIEDAVQSRVAAEARNIQGSADRALGVDGARYSDYLEGVKTQRVAEAERNYAAAYAQPSRVTADYDDAFVRAEASGAVGRAQRAAQVEGAGFHTPQAAIDAGEAPVTMRGNHLVIQELNDMISSAMRSGDNNAARRLLSLKNEFEQTLDNPAFRQAQDAYANQSALIGAAEEGRNFAKIDPEALAAQHRAMPPDQAEAARLGMARDFEDSTARIGGRSGLMGNEMLPRQIGAVTDAQTGAAFAGDLADILRMRQAQNAAFRGSQTAQRLLDDEAFEAGVGMAADIASGGVGSMVRGLAGRLGVGADRRFSQARAQAMAPMLMERPDLAAARLRARQGTEEAWTQGAGRRAQGAGFGAGMAVGDAVGAENFQGPPLGSPLNPGPRPAPAAPQHQPAAASAPAAPVSSAPTEAPAPRERPGGPRAPGPLGSLRPAAAQAVQVAGAVVGDPEHFRKLAMLESSGNPNARAATSSASGLFQLVDRTWRDAVRQWGAEFGVTQDMRGDPNAEAAMAAAVARDDWRATERRLKRPLQGWERYALHFLGGPEGRRFLAMADLRPDEEAAGSFRKAAEANPAIFYEGRGADRKPRTTAQIAELLSAKYAAA